MDFEPRPGREAFRFAVLPYANVMPLVHFLPTVCPRAQLLRLPPRDTARWVLDGRVDAAIVPVVDCFRFSGLQRVEGLGIAARGAVRSVLLRADRPIEEIRTVARDGESRTANALCEVLFRRLHPGGEVKFLAPPAAADAQVVIGDRALKAPPAPWCYDLAELWTASTNLPLVFAVWVHRHDHPRAAALHEVLHASRAAGGAEIPQLARLCAQRLGLPLPLCLEYLQSCIRYDIGPAELAGLSLFQRLWAQASPAQALTQSPAEA